MSDEPQNMVLRYLRNIDACLDRIEHKLDELTTRIGGLERDGAAMKSDIVGLQIRMDNMDRRLSRIERRLELTEGAI